MKQHTSRTKNMLRLMLVSACLLAVGACSEVGRKLPPPQQIMATQQGAVQRTEYRLVAGDKLQVKFPYHHARDSEVPIRPDGKISLDVTGDIQAEGLTAQELADVIKEKSAKYLRNPEVVVVVATIGDRRVYVGGEVTRPGYVVIQEGMTPLQAVMAVGGFKDTAQKSDVLYISRGANGEYSASRVDLQDVVTNGTPEVVRLVANDVVYVPATRVANAGTFVKQYIRDLLPVDSRAGATAPIPVP